MLLTSPQELGQMGVVSINDDGMITGFIEKPIDNRRETFINAGVYYLDKDVLDYIPPDRKCSLEMDVFPKLIKNLEQFYGFQYNGYFIDIGIPKNYSRFCEDVKTQKIYSIYD